MNLREAFQKLQVQFEHQSHQHPTVRHFWLQAIRFVHPSALESIAQIFGQPLAEVTQWPCENNRIDFSCFVGEKEKIDSFRHLAEQSRQLFVHLFQQLGKRPRHTLYSPAVSWLADMYYKANRDPQSQLGVEYFALGEWVAAGGATKYLRWSLGEQSQAQLQSLRVKLGEPIAVHRIQALLQDVFTASATMITDILKEGMDDRHVRGSLDCSIGESPLSI